MRRHSELLCGWVLALASSPAAAMIVIDSGPTYTPPGVGTVAASGTGAAFSGGRDFSWTGFDLSQTGDLYFGIKNDMYLTGFSTNGGAIAGSEIFRYDTSTSNTIVYTGETTLDFTDSTPSEATATRMTLTFSGSGEVIADATTAGLNNGNADVGALWRVDGDFSVNVLIEAEAPSFDANAGNFEPGNDLFNRLTNTTNFGTGTSIDTGFYFTIATDPQAVPEANSLLVWSLITGGVALRRRRN